MLTWAQHRASCVGYRGGVLSCRSRPEDGAISHAQEDAIEVVTPLAGVEDGWDFRKGWGVGNSRKREQQERVQLA